MRVWHCVVWPGDGSILQIRLRNFLTPPLPLKAPLRSGRSGSSLWRPCCRRAEVCENEAKEKLFLLRKKKRRGSPAEEDFASHTHSFLAGFHSRLFLTPTPEMMKVKSNQTRTYDGDGYKKRAACLCFRSGSEEEVSPRMLRDELAGPD